MTTAPSAIFTLYVDEAFCESCGTISTDGTCHCTEDGKTPLWRPHDRKAMDRIAELRQQLADGNSEIERLRLLAEGKLTEAAKMAWAKVEASPSGGYDITVKAPMIELIAETLVQEFKAAGGTNYVEWNLNHEDLGPFTITMQRRDGKTPANVAAEAKEESADLRQQLEAERETTRLVRAGVTATVEFREWALLEIAKERQLREKAETALAPFAKIARCALVRGGVTLTITDGKTMVLMDPGDLQRAEAALSAPAQPDKEDVAS
jgi:hypothetical protein